MRYVFPHPPQTGQIGNCAECLGGRTRGAAGHEEGAEWEDRPESPGRGAGAPDLGVGAEKPGPGSLAGEPSTESQIRDSRSLCLMGGASK